MSAGKGDDLRPVNGDKFRSNYDKIFKKHESNPINPHSSQMEDWRHSPDNGGCLHENSKRKGVLGDLGDLR